MAKIILIKQTRYIRVPKLLFDLLGEEVEESIIAAQKGRVVIEYTTAPAEAPLPPHRNNTDKKDANTGTMVRRDSESVATVTPMVSPKPTRDIGHPERKEVKRR